MDTPTSYIKEGIQYNDIKEIYKKSNNGPNTLHRKLKSGQYVHTENRGEPEHIYKIS